MAAKSGMSMSAVWGAMVGFTELELSTEQRRHVPNGWVRFCMAAEGLRVPVGITTVHNRQTLRFSAPPLALGPYCSESMIRTK